MRTLHKLIGIWFLLVGSILRAQQPATQPADIVRAMVQQVMSVIEPTPQSPARMLTTRLEVTRADGLPPELLGASVQLAYQAPDRLVVQANVAGQVYHAGRDGQEIWIYLPDKQFGLIGSPDVPRFFNDPSTIQRTVLAGFRLPFLVRTQLSVLPLLAHPQSLQKETIGQVSAEVVTLSLPEQLAVPLHVQDARVDLAVGGDSLPVRIRFTDGRKVHLDVEFKDTKLSAPWNGEQWKLRAAPGAKVERVALSHLVRFMEIAPQAMRNRAPALGPARGHRRLVAKYENGRLEDWDGTRVLFLRGTPEEMGRQHGNLLRQQVRSVADRMLYGVGVASSFSKGRWFFSELEEAHRRVSPFVGQEYFREMDALAEACGIHKYEMQLANFFPELFHCSGFAVFGKATVGGRLYHGRILDYLKGVGLEENAVVMVFQPAGGNAWVNIGYAGFLGSVTAMNEKKVAIGEMGGRGEGNWDGKPMAQLVREAMEKANTLEEAVEVFRKGPRTCEYYYVISDGKTKRAVGIEATPEKFVTVGPGQWHPRLPHPVEDAVLLSADERYEALVQRVKQHYGRLDAEGARKLMERPVAMKSNIHSVLFAPETLDFWVANADAKNPAAHSRYTHYNLGEMLKAEPAR